MFLIGLHLDLTEVYALRRVASLASLVSSVLPFVLGLALATTTTPMLNVVLPEEYRSPARLR